MLILSRPMVGAWICVAATASGQPRHDFATLDVCEMVPAAVVARAVNGRVQTTRRFNDKEFGRCTYVAVLPGSEEPHGCVLWVQAASDFEELRKVTSASVTDIAGLGDAAYIFRDEDGRFKVDVVKKNDLMFQATADTADGARKVAEAVAAHLWSKTPQHP